ncbi:hypothetical protein MM1S1540310_1462 [Mycobacteroides abscessus subsp. bolletii 1S-154-0310]|uniref:Uncharacterized protein n=1 Tax=Mycobacteroides abscessus MAB_030201_1075 TaxID=1335410 RepID=A0A829PPK3_9MYCO|nr:hypothetical protein MA4S0726RB_1370 [Mycobacteroides abscessus 4S-0726-RB]EIU01347.1 hypothetical protein MA4S0726RA_0663 [Mycobacteroides abscessus 4S-0726-RA]EIU61578.1 hypothetical protein MM1S1510930_1904 [Mycobacteroides abscessus subsp. bolletii 1S-151-0930]EIU70292.1 hypothetical protein MM1S1520914_2112 [Mycobacteroides abscessus subsp. bolletii 1S-152-0914]EIU77019.1 hypothetical protein MM1S1530915_1454 [Mycobacteroides abscessus subsp. bolletii 1S-153-0915]EIU84677.1 hypothetica
MIPFFSCCDAVGFLVSVSTGRRFVAYISKNLSCNKFSRGM